MRVRVVDENFLEKVAAAAENCLVSFHLRKYLNKFAIESKKRYLAIHTGQGHICEVCVFLK